MIWSGADLTCYHKIDHELVAISKTDQQEDYDNFLTTMPIKYHTVGLTSGRCRSSQELSENDSGLTASFVVSKIMQWFK
jgi:hypothetical protein